jgi:peptidoglycan/LPS O-acetylase OafA/YrhL
MLALVPLLAALKQTHQVWHYWISSHPSAETEQRLLFVGQYFSSFRIDCMAIGGIGAWLALRNSRLLLVIFHPISQRIVAAIGILCLYKGTDFSYFHDDVFALLFLIVILNVAINKRSLVRLENRGWQFLGRISYGLYAYNWLANLLTIGLIVRLPFVHLPAVCNVYMYIGSFLFVTLFASASYYLMERRFLHLKRRFGSFSKVAMEEAAVNTSLPLQPP